MPTPFFKVNLYDNSWIYIGVELLLYIYIYIYIYISLISNKYILIKKGAPKYTGSEQGKRNHIQKL